MQIHGLISRVLPARIADGTPRIARVSGMGDQYANIAQFPPNNGAVEGSYWHASNPTFDTPIALGIDTAFSDTASPALIIDNDAAATRDIILDYIRWTYVVVPASATSVQMGVVIDNKNRHGSAGSAANVYNARTDNAAVSGTVSGTGMCRMGDITANATGTSTRRFGRATPRTGIPVVGDTCLVDFGVVAPSQGLMSGTGASQFVVGVGPAAIAPGHSLLLHLWHPANAVTAATVLFDVGWWER